MSISLTVEDIDRLTERARAGHCMLPFMMNGTPSFFLCLPPEAHLPASGFGYRLSFRRRAGEISKVQIWVARHRRWRRIPFVRLPNGVTFRGMPR